MNEIPASSSASRSGVARPRLGLLLALGGAIVTFLFVQVFSPNWRGEADETTVPVYIPRLSLIGFDVTERDGDAKLVVRLKNTGKAAALDVSVALQYSGGEAVEANAKHVSVSPGEDVSIELGALGDYLLQWQGTCAGCYFLGLGKADVMPVEVLANACKELIGKGKACRLDYRLQSAVLYVRFSTADGARIEGGRPVFVYLSQTAESSYRIPKY